MRLISVSLLAISVVFWGGLSFGRQTEKVFGNMTYWVGGPHSPRQVKLVNGKHEEDFLNIYYEGPFVYGDFNHDGLMDAAVVIMENFGGNADDYELAFLINDGKQLVHRASYYLDVWAIVNSVHAKDGRVIVDMYVHQKGDCNAGPSKRVRNVYEYNGRDDFAVNRKS